jgi:thiol-disulfide isomerase/thioredoxin
MPARLLLIAALATLLALPALGEPPTEAEIQQWFKDVRAAQEAFGKSGDTSQSAYWKMWRDTVAKFPVEELTPAQMSTVQERRLLTFGETLPRIERRLAEFEQDPGVNGAIALIIRMQFIVSDASQEGNVEGRKELLSKLLGHPGLPALVRDGGSRLLLRAIGELRDPAAARPFFGRLEALVSQLAAEGSHHHLDSIFAFYEFAAAAAPDAESRERLRASLYAYGERALAQAAAADPSDDLAFERRDVATLNGAALRGKLLNHPAPELRTEWCSDPAFKGLSSLKGRVVLLDFWDVNCGPCIQAFPKMRHIRERYKDLPVTIVGVTRHQGSVPFPGKGKTVATGNDAAKEREVMVEYLAAYDLTWPTVSTVDDLNSAEYGIRGIPSYVLVDASGVVRDKDYFNRGTLEEKFAKIDALLKEAGHAPPPPVAAPPQQEAKIEVSR